MRTRRIIFRTLIAACGAAGFCTSAMAANASDGYVTGFVTLPTGFVYFFQDGTISGSRPACDTGGQLQRWEIDATTPAGQAILSILLTAKSSKELIKITGSGTCPTGQNSESPGIIVTDDVQ